MKMIIYLFHEMSWKRIPFGKRFATVDSAMRGPAVTAESEEAVSDLLDKMSTSDVGSFAVKEGGKYRYCC